MVNPLSPNPATPNPPTKKQCPISDLPGARVVDAAVDAGARQQPVLPVVDVGGNRCAAVLELHQAVPGVVHKPVGARPLGRLGNVAIGALANVGARPVEGFYLVRLIVRPVLVENYRAALLDGIVVPVPRRVQGEERWPTMERVIHGRGAVSDAFINGREY